MSLKLTTSLGVLAAVLYVGPAFAKTPAGQAFITKAIQGNLAEVQMGQLAQEKGQNADVKSFGQQLVKDHNDANTRATAVANQIGATPPTEPNKKQKADYAKLSKLSGDAFDKQFATHMVMDHKKDIKEYQTDSKKKDPTADYASQTLPTLQQHLETAQGLTKSMTKK
jgi:putative membrane protein